MAMSEVAVLHKKKRKDFVPYFLGLVLFLYCTVHLVSFTAKAVQETHSSRVRRALGKITLINLAVIVCDAHRSAVTISFYLIFSPKYPTTLLQGLCIYFAVKLCILPLCILSL